MKTNYGLSTAHKYLFDLKVKIVCGIFSFLRASLQIIEQLFVDTCLFLAKQCSFQIFLYKIRIIKFSLEKSNILKARNSTISQFLLANITRNMLEFSLSKKWLLSTKAN